ncbi:MAG: hypothetical protein EOP04_05720 [Proteobacteria bacterium]|nr:MAG: hypothetical protein EOP04_05720 [Pseudomonadota bacterium]
METRPKMLKSVFLFSSCLAILAATGCGSPSAPDESTLQANTTSTNVDTLQRTLGSGFDSTQFTKLPACIEATQPTYSGAHSSKLSFLRDYSADELISELGIGVSAGMNLFGLVKAKVTGEVTNTMSTTDESSAFVYKFDITGQSALINNPTLNANGLSAYGRNDPVHFRATCGDSYVAQVTLGAQLFVGVKYTFTSQEDKERIRLLLKGSALWGLIKFSKTWTKEERDILRNVRVTIDAYQIGGNPSKLAELKDTIEQQSCSGDDPEKCAEGLTKLINYGADVFPEQLNGMKISNEPNVGPAIIDVFTMPYSSQPILDTKSGTFVDINVNEETTLDSSFADALNRLSRLNSNLEVEKSRRAVLLQFNLSDAEKTTVQIGKTDIANLIEAVRLVDKDYCTPARRDSQLMATCVAKVGLIETKGVAAMEAMILPPRL